MASSQPIPKLEVAWSATPNDFEDADTFNRADSSTSLGLTSSSGQAWQPIVGTWGITFNTAYSINGGAAIIDGTSQGRVGVTFNIFAPGQGLIFRFKDINNYWLLYGGTFYSLYKISNGAASLQITGNAPCASGQTVEVRLNGTLITTYINGLKDIGWGGTDFQTAKGVGLYRDIGASSARWNDFYATMDWTDETLRIRRSNSITTRRGRQRETDRIEAGTAQLTFNNLDNALIHSNQASPYYPFVKPRRPARLTADIPIRNYVSNSSFEVDTDGDGLADGWGIYNNDGPGATASRPANGLFGTYSQRITWSTNSSTKGILRAMGTTAWQPSTTYIVSFYARSNIATTTFLAWNVGPFSTVTISNPALSPTLWQRYVFKITWGASVDASLGPGSMFISIGGGAPGYIEFDGFQVELATATSEVSDYTPTPGGNTAPTTTSSTYINYPVLRGTIDGFSVQNNLEGDSVSPITISDSFRQFSIAETPSIWEDAVISDLPFAWYRLGEDTKFDITAYNYARDFTDPTSQPDPSKNGKHSPEVTKSDSLIFGDNDVGSSLYSQAYTDLPEVVGFPSFTSNSQYVEFWFQQDEPSDFANVIWSQGEVYCGISSRGGDTGSVNAAVRPNELFMAARNWVSSDPPYQYVGCNFGPSGTLHPLTDGKPHHIILTPIGGGPGSTSWRAYIDGIFYSASNATFQTVNYGVINKTLRIGIAEGGSLPITPLKSNNLKIDEFIIYRQPNTPSGTEIDHYNAGAKPAINDTTGGRIFRVLDSIKFNRAAYNLQPGNSLLGPADFSSRPKVLDHLQSISDTERGPNYISRTGKMTQIQRHAFLNSTSVATFGDDPNYPDEIPFMDPFAIDYDDKRIVNDAVVAKEFNPIKQHAQDVNSQGEFGRQTYSREDLLMLNDTEALDHANWIIQHYKDPVERITQLVVRGCTLAQWGTVLGLDIGSRVTVNHTLNGGELTNLMTNGFGERHNGYNFSQFTYDTADTKSPAVGSFRKTGNNLSVLTDDLIPVSPLTKTYNMSMWAKSGNKDGTEYRPVNHQYIGYAAHDIDGFVIDPLHYLKVSGSNDTTLAAQLNPGATTVSLSNASGWHNGATTYMRQFTWWPYSSILGRIDGHLNVAGPTQNITTPHHASLNITGDIDIRWEGALNNYVGTQQYLVSKQPSYAFIFQVNTLGSLVLIFVTGTGGWSFVSTVPIPFVNGTRGWLRATRVQSTGDVNFFYSIDGTNWTPIGDTITGGAVGEAMIPTSDPLRVGGDGSSLSANGSHYRAQVYNGVNGTLVADLDLRNQTTTPYFDATGKTWTLNGGATFTPRTGGVAYPQYTYSRNTQGGAPGTIDWWNAGGISGNTITLRSPWVGPTLPAGTPVRNNQSGSTYSYLLAVNAAIPDTWTFMSQNITGFDTAGVGTYVNFPYGTAYIKGLVLVNLGDSFTNTLRYSNWQLNENGYFNPRVSIEAIVEKIDHKIDPVGKWESTLYLSNADIQNYLILDHATLGKLDSGNKLAF